MAMHRTPEDHAANPPQSWQVVKVAPRAFELRQADGTTMQRFATRREAEEHKTTGFLVDMYRKEGRWFAGEQVPGWKPYRSPLHRLTQIHTTPDGEARTVTSDSADLTAAEAQGRKVQRLREAGRPFTEGPGWVEYPHPDLRGWSVRLEWADTAPAASTAGAVSAGDPMSVADAAGRVAYAAGRPRAAGADATVCALVDGMAVGHGAAAIFEAFTRGFDAAADEAAAALLAQPDPAPAAQLPHQWPGQLDLFAPAG